MTNLLKAIITKISGSAFSSDVGGRVYLDRAPSETEFPYCVFQIVSAVPEDVFTKYGEDILLQFSLFSTSSSVAEIAGMYEDLKTLFDDCSLTIPPSGSETDSLIWMKRESLATIMDEHTTPQGTIGVRAWHVEYMVLTQEI